MRLLRSLVKHEIQGNIYNHRVPVAIVILVLLFGLSLSALVGDYNRSLDDYSILLQADPPVFSLIKPSPLSIFSVGLNPQLNTAYKLNYFKQIEVGTSQKSSNWLFSTFTAPDTLYIFMVIITLLAVFFTFDAIVGEKERGTLQICLANSVPRGTYIISKIIGSYLSLAIPCVIIFLLGMGMVGLVSTVQMGGEEITRLFLYLFVSLMLVAVFICLGICISVVAGSSARSLVILIVIWAVAMYCFPSFASSVSQATTPVPQSREMNRKVRGIWAAGIFDREHLSTGPERREAGKNILTKTKRIESDYFARVNNQYVVYEIVGRLSPVTAYVNAATALLGNGITDLNRMKTELRQSRNNVAEAGVEVSSRFEYKPATIMMSIKSSLFDVAELMLSVILLIVGAIALFNKSTIR